MRLDKNKGQKAASVKLSELAIFTLVLTIFFSGITAAQSVQTADNIEAVIESVSFDLPVELEVTCILPPEGASPFVAKFVFKNAPPVRPSDPDFPSDYCLPNAALYSTAKGEGVATHLGRFEYSERYCGMPGFRIVADIVFTTETGDELYATALAQAGPTFPPPFPHAAFTGEFTFTGGTGRFEGAKGRASISAKQLGNQSDPNMPTNIPGSTAVVLCGWIELQSDK